MADDIDLLGKFRGVLPSRAALARLSIFGTSEETRSSAQAILDALPPMNEKERQEYLDETWRLANTTSLEDMKLSPTGLATLELFAACKPVGDEVTSQMSPNSPATDAEVQAESAPPEPVVEPVNEHLARLNWPPRSTQSPAKPVEDDGVEHKWQAARPSAPDTTLKPLAAEDF